LNYAGLAPQHLLTTQALHATWRLARRGLILASAVVVAFLVSGGVFTFTPLVGVRIAHTSGISMEPAYKEGDVVLIKDAGESNLHVGDIVVFNALGQQFMHRIIEQRTEPNGELIVVTQGDNVARPDFPIRASQVSGKLVGEIPLLGTLSRLIDAEGGFYVYRSAVLTLAVTAVAVWGLAASTRRRQGPSPLEAAPAAGEQSPREPEAGT
jgi:signal peptidase I